MSSVRGRGTCTLVDATGPHASPRPFDGATSSGESARVEDAVFVFKDTKSAGGPLDAFHAATAPVCLQATQQNLFAQSGSGLEVVEISPLIGLVRVGDDHAGYGMVATDQTQTVTFYAHVLAFRAGRAVLIFKFDSFDQPFAEGLDVIKHVVARVAHTAKRETAGPRR